MNYNLFKRLPLSFILIMTICFSSCTEEENDIIEPEDPEEVFPEDRPNEESNVNCVLISVTRESRSSSNQTITNKVLHTPIYEVNAWSGKTILKSYKKGDSSYSLVCKLPDYVHLLTPYAEAKCSLNISGLISENNIEREIHSFKYDNKNRLIERKMQYGSEIQTEKYTYDSNYNIIGYKRTRNGEVLDEAQIEYTTIPAKTIPLQCFDSSYGSVFGDIFCIEWPLLEMGLYGNTIPLYLVDKIIYKDSGKEVEKVFEYTLDKNGYVIEMVEMDYRASETFISRYLFEWQPVSVLSYTNWLFSDIGSPYYRYL